MGRKRCEAHRGPICMDVARSLWARATIVAPAGGCPRERRVVTSRAAAAAECVWLERQRGARRRRRQGGKAAASGAEEREERGEREAAARECISVGRPSNRSS